METSMIPNYNKYQAVDFSILKGETIVEIKGLKKESEVIQFLTKSGKDFRMFHSQDCCEDVSVEDFEIHNILNNEIIEAFESSDEINMSGASSFNSSNTWTFYRLYTNKGFLFIRWHGQSNGYYSEKANFGLIKNDFPSMDSKVK